MPDEELCKMCNFPQRSDCVNGHVLRDDLHAKECLNLRRLRLVEWSKRHLTPELYDTARIPSSPLYVPGEKHGHPVVDHTKNNLFIKGITWTAFKPHLRYALLGSGVTYKVISDSRIRDVFVGGEAYLSRPKAIRDSMREAPNIVADLVGGQFDLVIIQLGILGYKNISAPGILREALMVRNETLGKPTWLFESSDTSIVWEFSKDGLVEAYVQQYFQDFEFNSDGKQVEEEEIGLQTSGIGDEEAAPVEHAALVPEESRGSASVASEETDLLAGMLEDEGGKKKTRWKGRR